MGHLSVYPMPIITKKKMNKELLIPVDEVNITYYFHEKVHLGVDFGWIINLYQPILACDDGVVVDVRFATEMGNLIVLEHRLNEKEHFWTGYIHLHKLPVLKKGEKVKMGDVIGIMGNTGKSNGNHLHLYLTKVTTKKYNWSTMRGLAINPLPFLYCDRKRKYRFSDKFTPKWMSEYPEPVERNEEVYQVRINSDTRNLRKMPNGEVYPERCKRGLYNVYDVQKAGNYRWANISPDFWVALMSSDDEYMDYKSLYDDLKTVYENEKKEMIRKMETANKRIEDLKQDIAIYQSQKEALIKQRDEAESKLDQLKEFISKL